MLGLNRTKLGNTNYEMQATRIVGGFANPIDAEIISNKIYAIEYGGNQGLWEITFPPAASPSQLKASITVSNGTPALRFFGVPNFTYDVQRSTNPSPAFGSTWTTPAQTNYPNPPTFHFDA